ncbi:MAG: hypothetical protein ACOVQ6_00615 [Brevundimonas sp.]
MRVSPAPDGKVFVAIRDQSELLSKADAQYVALSMLRAADGDQMPPDVVISIERFRELLRASVVTTAAERP